MPISCCHPATINPSDLMPPYFTIIVPIAQLKPAERVIRKPKIFSKIFISIERKKIPIIPKIKETIIEKFIFSYPKIAAKIFNLKVLEDEIQTIKDNATRFVFIQTQNPEKNTKNIDKASFKFQLDHKRGSLAALLNVLSDCKMNLTKIQSLPVIETPWKYSFFVDVTFDEYKNYEKAKAIIKIMAEEFKILGTYKNARK